MSAALPVPVAAQLPDFSERLSPMLVKELRQGMRSPLFVWGMIAMNLFLGGVAWLTVEDPYEDDLHQAFFGAYCALVCGLLPLRAAGALYDELRGNTIDTLVLTRLSGWRITLGKWIAVVAQQALVSVTLLPYLIVRYFAGGINVPMELLWLLIFFLVGAGSAAVMTGLSWMKYFLFRAAVMMGMTLATGAFCLAVLETIYGYRNSYILDDMLPDGTWRFALMMLAAGVYVAFFCLDLGAAQVSSLLENRSLRRRLTALGFIVFYLLLLILLPMSTGYLFEAQVISTGMLCGGTLALAGWQALLEKPVNLVAASLPWVRRGWPGRVAARFLQRGWPSGVVFLLGLVSLAGLIGMKFFLELTNSGHSMYYGYEPGSKDIAVLVTAAGPTVAMLLVPLVLWYVFLRKRVDWHLGTYLMILGSVGALQIGLMGAAKTLEDQNLLKGGLPIPTMAWSLMDHAHRYEARQRAFGQLDWGYLEVMFWSWIVSFLWCGAAALIALHAFRETRAVEQEALALLAEEKAARETDP